MVDLIVNDKESVMRHLEDPDRDGWILGVMPADVQFKLVTCLLCINGGVNARIISMLTFLALELFNTVASIATPCSVKA